MKKLNMVTTAAVATVMTASSAHADLSLGGAIASVVTSGDSISVSYTHLRAHET